MVNLIQHTMILIGILIEITLVYHPIPTSGTKAVIGFTSIYLTWMSYLGIYHDDWVYPFVQTMPSMYKPVYLLFVIITQVLLAKLGEVYYKFVWSEAAHIKVAVH